MAGRDYSGKEAGGNLAFLDMSEATIVSGGRHTVIFMLLVMVKHPIILLVLVCFTTVLVWYN